MKMLDHGDVRWAFFDILGRDPANDYACDWHISVSKGSASALRDLILNSTESQNRQGISPSSTSFCAYRPDSTKIIVLGNCQAPNIARFIVAATDCSVLGIEVMGYDSNPLLFEQVVGDADIIVVPDLSDQFDRITLKVLRERFSKTKIIISYAPFYFTGEQPDIVYWGGRGKRILSPIGDYHSRIALRSYMTGMSFDECADSFSAKNFHELGYFEAAEKSILETRRREMTCDVHMADFLEREFGINRLCLSVNHPTSLVFSEFASQILNSAGVPYSPPCQHSTPNMLLTNVIWPLNPIIVQHHGMKVPASDVYFKSGVMLTHDDFLRRSYRIYDELGRINLMDGASPEQQKIVLG